MAARHLDEKCSLQIAHIYAVHRIDRKQLKKDTNIMYWERGQCLHHYSAQGTRVATLDHCPRHSALIDHATQRSIHAAAAAIQIPVEWRKRRGGRLGRALDRYG